MSYKISKIHLSEDTIRNLKGKLNWKYVCQYSKLTDFFMEESNDYIIWDVVSIYQKLSEPFTEKHKVELD